MIKERYDNVYSADFEATVEEMNIINENDKRVIVTWAGLQSCKTMKQQTFTSRYKGNKFIDALESFMKTVKRLKNGSIVIFHNLKGYDHGFIFYWLLKNEEILYGKQEDFYWKVSDDKTIRFFDSLNLLETSIKGMGPMVGLTKGGDEEIATPLVSSFDKNTTTLRGDIEDKDSLSEHLKLIEDLNVIDAHVDKENGYVYSVIDKPVDVLFKELKWDIYANEDINILAYGIIKFKIPLLLYNKINTKASWAWQNMWNCDYTKSEDDWNIDDYFEHSYSWLAPIGSKRSELYKFEKDSNTSSLNPFTRSAYKGGITYVSQKYLDESINGVIKREGTTFDINSMYPWIYSTKSLPKSDYKKMIQGNKDLNPIYENDLSIVRFKDFVGDLKDNYNIPLLKNRTDKNDKNENTSDYLPHYEGDLMITGVEARYILKAYDCSWSGYLLMVYEEDKLLMRKFKNHGDYWMHVKEKASQNGLMSYKFIAKLMLNCSYGKAGQYLKEGQTNKFSLEDGVIKSEGSKRIIGNEFANLAAAAHITAYGRVYLCEMANKYGDDFVYCDTDSLHVFGNDKKLPIHSTKLGYFDEELNWSEGAWLGRKTYMEKPKGKDNYIVHVAGLNRPVTVDNFKLGSVLKTNKGTYARGGRMIVKTPFTIGGTFEYEEIQEEEIATNNEIKNYLKNILEGENKYE